MGYKQYCKEPEKIENYEKAKKDNFVGWECHHRLETHTPDGKRREFDISYKELIALGMYYSRPAEELIFLTTREHNAFKKGKHHSDETRRKLKGNKNALGHCVSEETRRKMREAKKGKPKSEEHKKKIGEAQKGNKYALGHCVSEETKKKMREASKGNTNTKGKHWYNNGKINTMAKECPPGFVPGQLR